MADAVSLARTPTRWAPWLLAALPAVWMLTIVWGDTHLQYEDYWRILADTSTPDGGFDLGSLLVFNNEHPVAVPNLLYWANIYLADGSNLWLGTLAVVIVFAQVVVLSRFIPAGDRRSWAAAAFIVAASILLFSRQGAWNFTRSMSGIAWFTANLCVLGAIVVRWRGRVWPAVALGLVASLSLTTGLLVWPVLVLVGLLVDRRWRPDWRVVGIGAAVWIWYLFSFQRATISPAIEESLGGGGRNLPAPLEAVSRALATAGSLFTWDFRIARVLGLVAVTAGFGLCAWALRRRSSDSTPWIALFSFSLASLLMVSAGRLDISLPFRSQGRYVCVAALLWISVGGLAGSLTSWRPRLIAPTAIVAAFALTVGAAAVRQDRETLFRQRALAAAYRLDLVEGRTDAFGVPYPAISSRLEALGHYPFSDRYDDDCGLLGDQLDIGTMEVVGQGETRATWINRGVAVRLTATVPEPRVAEVDCVVVADQDGRVVGIGELGVAALGGDVVPNLASAIAPPGSTSYAVVLTDADDQVLLNRPVDESEIVVG
jgi:hypothetical protein